MSGQDNEEMGFQQHREGGFINCPSSGMGANPFFGSGWDPLASLAQSENFGGSSAMVSHSQAEFCNPHYNQNVMESQGMSSAASHVVQYPSDSSYAEMVPKLPGFGSGSFSDMVGSYGYPQIAEIANPPNYGLSKEKSNERSSGINSQNSDGKRRKRAPDSNSPISSDKNGEGEKQKDLSAEISEDRKEQDEKKPKVEENSSANIRRKETGKQTKETSNSEENPKDNYIHVRARRGQATNSHSLAERVRREKISERMRLLQELVPGCNKITGKAVMLDEIINYVQSLQQQVEFLSMKLATVNPELNVDLERLLSKDILNSRGGNSALYGLSPSIGASQHYPHGMFQGAMPSLPTSTPQFASLSQAVLDPELQGLFHMGFDSNSGIDNLGPNGRLKPEL